MVTAVAVLAQAEIIGRHLPALIDGDRAGAPTLAAALVGIGLIRFLLRWATELSSSRAAAGARATITDRVISHALAIDEPGAGVATPSRVTTLVTDGTDALEPWIREYVPALCIAGVLPLAAGARILAADVPSGLILLVTIPLIPVFMVLIGKLAEDRADRQWATLQRLAAHFHDVLVGLPTLRLFGRVGPQVQRVREVAEQYRVAVMRTLRVAFLSAAAMELLAMLSVALVAVTIGYRLSVGTVSLQAALVVLLLAPECSLPIRRVGSAFHAAQAGTDAADELRDLLATTTTPDGPVDTLAEPAPATPVLRISGAIVADPQRGVRVGPVDLEVHAGSLIALVGASGAGKSTLLDAVRGRVPVHRGRVEVAGIDVAQLSRTTRTDAIVWIPQLPDPVGADVRAAVVAGSDPADAEAIDRVLDAVDLVGLADRDPTELSGGERQRLAVARGVLRSAASPEVRLVLADEPTSQLDGNRRALVIDALRRMASEGLAVVVATHDPVLIEAADHVARLGEELPPPAATGRVAAPVAPDVAEPTTPQGDPTRSRSSRPSPPNGQVVDQVVDHHAGHNAELTRPEDDLIWFRRMSRPVRWRLRSGRALAVSTDLCGIALAATAAWMLAKASMGTAFAELAVAAVLIRVFAIGKGLLRYSERLVSHDATFRMLADVRGAVVARLGRIAPAGVPGMERGDVMARVVDDVDRLADQELRVTGPMTSGVIVGMVAVAAAAVVAPGFGVVYAAAVVLLAIVLPAATRRSTAGAVRDQLAQRTRRAVARIRQRLLAMRQRVLVEFLEAGSRHVDLATHFKQRRPALAAQSQRDGPNGPQIGGDILASGAVATRGTLHQPTVLIAQADRQAVELGLGTERWFVLAQRVADAAHEVAYLLVAEGIGQRQHRDRMPHLGEATVGLLANAMRGGVGIIELWMRRLQRFQFAHQSIVFGVRNRRIVEHVVAVIGVTDLRAQLGNALARIGRHGFRPAAQWPCDSRLRS